LKAKVEFAPVSHKDIDILFDKMRDGDYNELVGHRYYKDPRRDFKTKIGNCEWAATGYINGHLACMFGISPLSSVRGRHCVWVLTTNVIDQYPVTFYKESVRVARWMRKNYYSLENWVDLRYTEAINWLDRLGATFYEVHTAWSGVEYQRVVL
jgi:hypothetical protein